MSIKWHKQKRHGRALALNIATVSKYGIHFGCEFVENYKINDYEYACVGLTDDNHIVVRFLKDPVGMGYNYKICFNKSRSSRGCFIGCSSFVKDLPINAYNTMMRVDVNVLAGMIFELKFMKEE